jgi:16S rRNA (uracil1498-N3)-methyltransferase
LYFPTIWLRKNIGARVYIGGGEAPEGAARIIRSVHRFFAPSMDPGDESVALPRDEAEHLTRVLRLGVGDTVAVFDGRGREFLARVVSATRRDVRVQVLSRREPAAETAVPVTLAQAVLKGDKMDDVVRDAVMLGVVAIQPLVTRRSETTVAALMRGSRVDRWRRVALASVKQSRRAVLPDIHTPLSFEHYLAEPRAALRLMLVEPQSGAPAEPLSALHGTAPPSEAAVMVGAEGGWTEQELEGARVAGVRLMTFGQRTLRADAVAVATISVLQFLWDR